MREKLRVGIINDTALNGHYGCIAVMDTIIEQLKARNVEIVFSLPTASNWKEHVDLLENSDLDLFIVNGEGSIHNTETNNRASLLCEFGSYTYKKLKIPAFLINVTLQNLDKHHLRHISNYQAIYVRETNSRNYLYKHGIDSVFVPDLSFFYLDSKKCRNIERNNLLVTDSVKKRVSDELSKFADENQIEFIKMVDVKTNIGERILKKISRLIPITGKIQKGLRKYDIDSLENFIHKLKCAKSVTTGRFHTVTLCLATKTPFHAIESNTGKIGYILNDCLGNINRIIDTKSLNSLNSRKNTLTKKELGRIDHYKSEGLNEMNEMFDKICNKIIL